MNLRLHSPWWRRGARSLGCRLFRLAENNDDARSTHNGERWLLRQLIAAHGTVANRPLVVADGGANVGDYTSIVLEEARRLGCNAEVHAFEPSPHNIECLRKSFVNNSDVHVVGAALADHAGEAVLFDGRSGSRHASLLSRPARALENGESVAVPVLRLGDYLEINRIGRLDLLKLDIEGYELAALRGLGGHLRPETIDVIQFEYGGTTADAGTTLRAFYGLLEGRGFIMAKLFPSALEVRPYRPWMENYAYANYVALSPRWRNSPVPI